MNKMKVALASLVATVLTSSAYAVPVFELPASDVTQIKADFVSAGVVILGIALTVFGYRLIRKLLGK